MQKYLLVSNQNCDPIATVINDNDVQHRLREVLQDEYGIVIEEELNYDVEGIEFGRSKDFIYEDEDSDTYYFTLTETFLY